MYVMYRVVSSHRSSTTAYGPLLRLSGRTPLLSFEKDPDQILFFKKDLDQDPFRITSVKKDLDHGSKDLDPDHDP